MTSHDVQPPDQTMIRSWCRAYLAKVMRVSETQVDDEAPMTALGMDSAELVFMVAALEDQYRLQLASDTTMEFPTIAALAEFIAAEIGAQRPSK